MVQINNRETGSNKEIVAANYLKDKGYSIVETNFRVRQGEIDIIAKDKATIVFVEVKYRYDEKSGHPLEAVGLVKQKKICKCAMFYINKNKIPIDCVSIRFDVVGILKNNITHIENAFDFIC